MNNGFAIQKVLILGDGVFDLACLYLIFFAVIQHRGIEVARHLVEFNGEDRFFLTAAGDGERELQGLSVGALCQRTVALYLHEIAHDIAEIGCVIGFAACRDGEIFGVVRFLGMMREGKIRLTGFGGELEAAHLGNVLKEQKLIRKIVILLLILSGIVLVAKSI